MKNNEVNINGKTILFSALFILGMIALIFILDNYDFKRKSKQIRHLYSQVENSKYIDSLNTIINNFKDNSTNPSTNIRNVFDAIKVNIPEINNCDLYVRKNGEFVKFSSYLHNRSYSPSKMKVEDKLLYEQLKHSKNRIEDLIQLNKEFKHIKTCNFLNGEDEEPSALIVTQYRK